MNMLLLNIILALVWGAFTGHFTFNGIVIGFLLGYGILWMAQPMLGRSSYFRRFFEVMAFTGYFIKELFVSSLRVARDAMSIRLRARPGVIAVPLDIKDDWKITLLANLITLTPGTLTLDISDDKKTLYVHVMYLTDPQSERQSIKNGMEKRLMKVLR